MKINLKKFEKIVKSVVVYYVLGLILSKRNKTCPAIASLIGLSHDKIYRYLSANADLTVFFPDLMIKLVKHFHAIKPGCFIIDDTTLSKIYAKYIEGIHMVYNSSLGKPEKGLCVVVMIWSNGEMTIPIAFRWWFSKDIAQNSYFTKLELARELIRAYKDIIGNCYVLADGAYLSAEMIEFYIALHKMFISRVHSNRKITTEDGVCEQIKRHPALKLRGNQRAKKVLVLLQNQRVYIVVFKRLNKRTGEYDCIYLATNSNDTLAHEVVEMYEGRWPIESMFRTAKQSFGLSLCQSRDIEKQHRHVTAVFLALAFVNHEKYTQNLECPEDAVRRLQILKPNQVAIRIARFCRDFDHVA